MEARIYRAVALVAAVASMGASYRTPNFVVTAPTAEFATEAGEAAEKYRRELAQLWLGRELPRWAQPCPIVIQVGPNLGAGGATTFVFDRGEVFGWHMSIQGTPQRLLDSVLPHEITHTIFASHFRRPLPRWADEGACTTVEHASERRKQQQMLVQFLKSNRGIAFSQMFAMRDYPPDVLPLYSEGFSLCRFLIEQGGRKKFVGYIGEGMRSEQWAAVTKQYYGYNSLAELQNAWLAWVESGSPKLDVPEAEPAPDGTLLVAGERRPRPEPNLIYRAQNDDRPAPPAEPAAATALAQGAMAPANAPPGGTSDQPLAGRQTPDINQQGWHAATTTGSAAAIEAYPKDRPQQAPPAPLAGTLVASQQRSAAAQAPDPSDKTRQVILEWGRQPDPARQQLAPSADAALSAGPAPRRPSTNQVLPRVPLLDASRQAGTLLR
jgi:hypothetical protein